MFSGIPQKNRQAAETYFDEHLSHNDYYSQGQKECGHWIGMGAEMLGLKPGEVVTRETFLKLCDNRSPETNEQLTPQNFKGRRIFFDFTCSPPKSVSILAVTMNDGRIVEAHKEASTIAIRELEQFAAARIRKGGIEDRDRTTGNVVGAASAGARHIAIEHLKLPVETNHPLWPRLLAGSGRDLRADYIHAGAKLNGRELVLPPEVKLPVILEMRDAAQKAGVSLGVADNEFQYLSDSACCCSGVDKFRGFEGWFKHQVAYAVRRCRRQRITYEAVSDFWSPEGSVDRWLNSHSRVGQPHRFLDLGTRPMTRPTQQELNLGRFRRLPTLSRTRKSNKSFSPP